MCTWAEELLSDSENQDTHTVVHDERERNEHVAFPMKESTDADEILQCDDNMIENAFLKNKMIDQDDSNVLLVNNHSLVFFSNTKELSTFI